MKYKLQDLIDMEHFQNLQYRLNEIYSFPSSIIDNDGNILTATAWQDICTQFHRKNKDCEKLCIKSDQYIKDHIHEANPAVSYRCPHGLVDNATPIIIDGIHYGNFFTGQFFLKEPDMEFFRAQAKKYGFDEDAYLKAVKRVPIWTQEQLNSYLFFIKELIAVISESGLKTIKEMENRKRIEASEKRHKSILKSAMDGYWLTDIEGRLIEVNDTYCRMSGYSEDEILTMRIPDLEAVENLKLGTEHMQKVVFQGSDRFESKHRRKDGTVFDVEVSIQFRPDEGGQCVCFLRDITGRKQVEGALLAINEDLKISQQIAHVGSWHLDVSSNQVVWSEELYKMYGFDPALPPPRYTEHQKLFTPESWERLSAALEKTRNKGIPYELELETVRKDGSCGWMWVYGESILDTRGVIIGLRGAAQDITDRKRAEKAMQVSEQLLSAHFKNTTVGAIYWDLDFQVVEWNPAAESIFGYTKEEAVGKHAADLIIPEEIRSEIDLIFKELLVQKGGTYSTNENITKDGRRIICDWYNTNIKDSDGKTISLASFVNDVTERIYMAQELQKEKDIAQRYLNLAGVVFIGLDVNGNINIANKKAQEILECGENDIIGQNWFDNFIPQNIRSDVHSVFKQLIIGNVEPVEYYENSVMAKNGNEKLISWHNTYLKDNNGKIIGILCSGEDITEKRKLQAQLQQSQKLEAIGNLAGGIAHDFNNILSSVIGYTELAIDDAPKGTPLRDNLQEVYTAGKRARDLVKQILAFARQSDEEKKPIQVDTIAEEALKLIRSTTPTSIEIRQTIESHSLIMGNPTQLHQIFMNLCTNAAQAMEDSGGILEVGLEDVTLNNGSSLTQFDIKPGNYVKVTVSDTGPGIAPDIIGSIFEPYFTTKGVGKGTGLGLATVHGIVETYGGKITAESELGKGTVFSIYLPITKEHEDYRPYEEEKLPCGTERILFVDDELPIAKMGSQILERLGYQVTVRTSSVEARELFRTKPKDFDLVITDMTMPNMTGDELAIELMRIRSDIPVILCTGYSKKISDETASKIGIKAFAYKPVVKADLAKTVRKVLDGAKNTSHA